MKILLINAGTPEVAEGAREWFAINKKSDDVAEIMIYDQIGGWSGFSSKGFVAALKAITAKQINLQINSPGGDVIEAFAMFNAIKAHKAKVSVKVEGLAASAASLIAMAGDSICMCANAFMMIHNVTTPYTSGDAADLRAQAEVLDKMTSNVAEAYAKRTGQTVADVKTAMNAGTWFDADEAVDWGLADSVEDDGDEEDGEQARARAMSSLAAVMQFKNVPERIRKYAASLAGNKPQKEKPMPFKPFLKDGKQFVTIDGKDHEIEPTNYAPANPAAQLPAAAPGTAVAKTQAEYDADLAKARAQGAKETADRQALLATALASTGLKDKEAEAFMALVKDLDEAGVKAVASTYVAKRTVAVGEGAGGEGKDKPDATEAECAKRFAEDGQLRQMWNVHSSDAAGEDYKKGLARFVAQSKKYAGNKTVEFTTR